jgi:hypothetical protein
MAWEPDFVEDGATATAAYLNNLFGRAQSWINNVNRAGIRRGAFNHHHAPTIGPLSAVGTYTTYADLPAHGIHTYDRTLATFGVCTTYTGAGGTYGTNGVSETNATIGTNNRAIVGHPNATGGYTGGTAKLTMPGSGFLLGMARGDRCAGILIEFNVDVRSFTSDAASTPWAMFALHYEINGGGGWKTIDQSEMGLSLHDHVPVLPDSDVDLDVPLTAFLSAATLSANGDNPAVDRVTAICASLSLWDAASVAPEPSITLASWNLTALPLHAQLTEP